MGSIPQEGDKNIVITDETVDGKEQNLLLLTTLKDNYYEKPYEKNIIGGLKEIAWQVKKEKGEEIGREIKGEREREEDGKGYCNGIVVVNNFPTMLNLNITLLVSLKKKKNSIIKYFFSYGFSYNSLLLSLP